MRALLAAFLLLAARLPECGGLNESEGSNDAESSESEEADAEDDSDSAPFMIVVEHVPFEGRGEVWRCSGSLVSMRTGVTSAECARGRRPSVTRELWALAAATAAALVPRADGARRVSRVATAGNLQRQEAARGGSSEASSAALDLAVLELDSPFGSSAHARPILMATSPNECLESGVCHVVRAQWRGAGAARRARLRIVDARLSADAGCSAQVPDWSVLRERALCLAGPQLCEPECGAGVVCGGKLCGVVSRAAAAHPTCAHVHAAQSVARWRRFLHCAHTLRACGRGACTELCSERRLSPQNEDDELGRRASEPEPSRRVSVPEPAPAPAPRAYGPTSSPPSVPAEDDDDDTGAVATKLDSGKPTRLHSTPADPTTGRPRVAPALRGSYGPAPTRTAWSDPETDATDASTATAPSATATATATATPTTTTRSSSMTKRSTALSTPMTKRPPKKSGLSTLLVEAREPRPRPLPHPLSAKQAPATAAPATAATSPIPAQPVRNTALFEPNRPDFKAGEYDEIAEYAAPPDGYGGGGGGGGGRGPVVTSAQEYLGAPARIRDLAETSNVRYAAGSGARGAGDAPQVGEHAAANGTTREPWLGPRAWARPGAREGPPAPAVKAPSQLPLEGPGSRRGPEQPVQGSPSSPLGPVHIVTCSLLLLPVLLC